jgi:hypothetical protein
MFALLKKLARRVVDVAFTEPDPLWEAYIQASQSELNGSRQAEAAMRLERDSAHEQLAEARATSDLHRAAAERAMRERDAMRAALVKAHRYAGCREQPEAELSVCFICEALATKGGA